MTEENKEDKEIKDNTFSLLFRSDKGIKKYINLFAIVQKFSYLCTFLYKTK